MEYYRVSEGREEVHYMLQVLVFMNVCRNVFFKYWRYEKIFISKLFFYGFSCSILTNGFKIRCWLFHFTSVGNSKKISVCLKKPFPWKPKFVGLLNNYFHSWLPVGDNLNTKNQPDDWFCDLILCEHMINPVKSFSSAQSLRNPNSHLQRKSIHFFPLPNQLVFDCGFTSQQPLRSRRVAISHWLAMVVLLVDVVDVVKMVVVVL